MDDLKTSLLEVGLSPKEADVYLAMLELGPSSVQDISKKAGVNRTTTYVMLEGLQRHGLMSSFEKGKKILFVAENPQRLVSLIADRLSKEAAKRDRLESFMPRLLAIFNAIQDKPKVRFFEGEEALDQIRMEMADTRDRIWEVYAADELSTSIAPRHNEQRIELTKEVHSGRVLIAIKPGSIPLYFDRRNIEARLMDFNAYPFSGSITVAENKMCIITSKSRGMGIVVESKEISDIFRAMYEAVWIQAKPWIPPPGWQESGQRKN